MVVWVVRCQNCLLYEVSYILHITHTKDDWNLLESSTYFLLALIKILVIHFENTRLWIPFIFPSFALQKIRKSPKNHDVFSTPLSTLSSLGIVILYLCEQGLFEDNWIVTVTLWLLFHRFYWFKTSVVV